MPVNSVQPNFNNSAAMGQGASTLQELLGKQLMQNQQIKAQQGQQQVAGEQQSQHLAQQGQQAQDLAKYKDTLGQEGTQRNIQTAQDLADKNQGSGVTVGEGGNIGITRPTPDPYAKNQAALQKQDNDAYKTVYNNYNKGLDKQIDQVQKMDKLMQDLNNPNAISGGIAKTEIIGALGMNRYNQQEASSIYGPTASGLYAKVANALGGSEGTLSPAQLQATKAAVMDMYGAAKSAHDAKRSNALDMYKGYPTSNPQTYQKLQDNMGGAFNKYASDFENKYAPKQGPQMQAQGGPQQPQQQPGMADKLTSWLRGSPAQAQPQNAMQEFQALKAQRDAAMGQGK